MCVSERRRAGRVRLGTMVSVPAALLLSLVSARGVMAEPPGSPTVLLPGVTGSGAPGADVPVPLKGAAVVGCEEVKFTGSAKINSWDSRDGLYSPALARDNTLVATVSPNADILIQGGTKIYADLYAVRDLKISNGGVFAGNLYAGRNIDFTANPACPAAGVYAGGVITNPGAWWISKCGGGSGWVANAELTLPKVDCDPRNVTDLVNGMIAQYASQGGVQPWPYPGWRPNPVLIEENASYNSFYVGSGPYPLVIDATKVDYLYIDGNFELAEGGQLHIKNQHGMSQVQELLIIVNGSFRSGGSSFFIIDPGISVRIYTTGQVWVGSGANQSIPPSILIDGKVQPTFGIYTSYVSTTSSGYGVEVIARSPLTAVVYAPLANVQISESGELFGAVRGKRVHVTGNAWIHYDESLDVNSGWDGGPIFETDLSVSLAVDTSKVEYNRDLTLTVSINGGDAGLFEGVKLGVELPSDLIYVSHQAPAGTSFLDFNGDGIPDTWQVDTVRAQETRVLQIVLRGPNRPDTAVAQINVALSEWSGSADAHPENNVGSLGVHILPSPLLTLTKAASAGALVPGEVIEYTTTLVNVAAAPAHHVLVSGKIDQQLVLKLDAFGAGVPFRFVEGETPSGLALGALEFSNDGGVTWSYTPVSGGGGAPAGFDATVTHWRISMVGVMNPKSSFKIEYQALLPWPEPGNTSQSQ